MLFRLTEPSVSYKHTSVLKEYADMDLIAAEAEIAALLERADHLPDGGAPAIKADQLDRFIALTRPATLLGAAVKLRRLLDAETGIAFGTTPLDVDALRQVLDLLHALVGKPAHATRPTTAPALSGARSIDGGQ
jgi:hypothetical protein